MREKQQYDFQPRPTYSYLNQLFLSGCPSSHVVQNTTSDTAPDILTDNCNEEEESIWLAPKGATDDTAEIVINMGCSKSLKGIHMKNIKKKQGGTKNFTIFVSDSPDGPWNLAFQDEFPEQETVGCAPMQNFYRYVLYMNIADI